MSRKVWVGGRKRCHASARAAPLLAHHAFSAEFDANAPVTLKGPVTKIEWINPHAWIHMENKAKDGKTEEWMVEGGTPNTLQRNGITRDSIKVGTDHRRLGLPGEGRAHARQRPRHHLPRRPHAVHGIVGHRRAARRQGSERTTQAERAVMMRLRLRSAGARRRDGRRLRRHAATRAAEQAYRAPRTPDGTPDLSGIWQANNTANWDLEPHEARMGPVVALARRLQHSARPRRRRRRRDSVSAGGAREAQRQSRRLDEARSRDQVLHAGHPARHLHAVSVPDRAVEGQRALHLRIHQRQPRRAHEQPGEEPRAGVDGMVDRQVGRRVTRRSK